MKTEISFTATSPPGIRPRNKVAIWSSLVCVAFVAWSLLTSSFIPVFVFAVFLAFFLITRTPFLQRKIIIKVGDGCLSVHGRDDILWKTGLADITAIELQESKRFLSAASGQALLIRDNRDDSYYLPLDGLVFEGHSPSSLVEALNEIKNNA